MNARGPVLAREPAPAYTWCHGQRKTSGGQATRRASADDRAAGRGRRARPRPCGQRRRGAHDFVAAIYAAHIGPNEGFALDGDDDFRRYFEPALADGMIRDAHDAAARHDRARPGYDVFVDADRWSLKSVRVAIAPHGPRRALATVTFHDAGRPKTIRLDLVRLPAGWRIRDIHAPSGDLRAAHAEVTSGVHFQGVGGED